MILNINEFINSCKLLLHEGVVEHNIIDGTLTKCSNYNNDKIEIIKSLEDYSMIIVKKDNSKPVICIDKDGYMSKIDSDWKELALSL